MTLWISPCTPMIDLGELECESLSSREVGEEIAGRALKADTAGQPVMAVITLAGTTRRMLQSVDPGVLQDARSRLLDLKIVIRSGASGTPLTDSRSLTGVNYVDLFNGYLKDQNLAKRNTVSSSRKVQR